LGSSQKPDRRPGRASGRLAPGTPQARWALDDSRARGREGPHCKPHGATLPGRCPFSSHVPTVPGWLGLSAGNHEIPGPSTSQSVSRGRKRGFRWAPGDRSRMQRSPGLPSLPLLPPL